MCVCWRWCKERHGCSGTGRWAVPVNAVVGMGGVAGVKSDIHAYFMDPAWLARLHVCRHSTVSMRGGSGCSDVC